MLGYYWESRLILAIGIMFAFFIMFTLFIPGKINVSIDGQETIDDLKQELNELQEDYKILKEKKTAICQCTSNSLFSYFVVPLVFIVGMVWMWWILDLRKEASKSKKGGKNAKKPKS